MVKINGQEVETKAINIICHNGIEDVKIDGHIGITIEHTLFHAERVRKLHADTARLVRIVFPDAPDTLFNVETRGQHGTGYRHVLGLVDMTLKFMDMGQPFYWKYPEAGLHPSAQCQLGDLLLALKKRGEDQCCHSERL